MNTFEIQRATNLIQRKLDMLDESFDSEISIQICRNNNVIDTIKMAEHYSPSAQRYIQERVEEMEEEIKRLRASDPMTNDH